MTIHSGNLRRSLHIMYTRHGNQRQALLILYDLHMFTQTVQYNRYNTFFFNLCRSVCIYFPFFTVTRHFFIAL